MKLLSVNKYFYQKGGAETYYFSLNKLLAERGVDVLPFSMKDFRNIASPYEDYFVDNIDYYDKSILKKVKYAFKVIYSLEARRKIGRLIRESAPDLVHLQNFYHQLSPSILGEIKKYNLPVVFTAHDLKLLCPNYQMLCRGEICEKCKGGRFFQCTLNRCVKDSVAGSLVNTAEMYLHRMLGSFDKIDQIITPSAFYRHKFIEFGFKPEKIVHIPNFIDPESFEPHYESSGYAAFVGRLSREKGILTLVKAMKSLPNRKLIIVGEGPLKPEIEKVIEGEGLKNIRLMGFKSGRELQDLIGGCYMAVLPSEWYENAPYSVLEAMAMGKPVIGADAGGIPELVQNGRTGLIFESKNAAHLSEQMNRLFSAPQMAAEMGREARRRIEKEFSRDIHYEKLSEVYGCLARK